MMMEFLKITVRQETIDPEASEIIKKDKGQKNYTWRNNFQTTENQMLEKS